MEEEGVVVVMRKGQSAGDRRRVSAAAGVQVTA